MPLEKTEAIVLKAYNWSESSRTIILFSRRFGKLAVIDKGGRSIKSRRGRLMPFHRLEITYYTSRKSGGYISDSDILESFPLGAEGELGRLAYASAACELLHLLLPEEEQHEELYDYFVTYLQTMSRCSRLGLPAVFVTFFLRLLSFLGYHPSLGFCIGCNLKSELSTAADSRWSFSPERGGIVCSSCQRPGEYIISLTDHGLQQLLTMQSSSLEDASSITIGYDNAVLLIDLLTRFLQYHAAVGSDLKSLKFLEKLKRSKLS